MNELIEELKRRKVFRVAVIYAVTAWIIIQAVVLLEEPLSLPDWFDTSVILLVGIGFPIALILAWAFDIKPDGASPEGGSAVQLTPQIIAVFGGLIGAFALGLYLLAPSGDDKAESSAIAEASSEQEAPDIIAVPGFGGRGALAVMPFRDMSAGGANEHIADGIAEDILTSIQAWGTFPVLSRSSTFAYKGQAVDIPTVAAALGVRYILEGSVQRAGDKIRVTAQLIDAETDSHLWAQKFDRELADVFAIQDEITEEIATAIYPEITRSEISRVASLRPADLEAWELTMKAQALIQKAEYETSLEAKKMLEDALAREPDYALAHVYLAEIGHNFGEFLGQVTGEQETQAYFLEALAHARVAVELEPSLVQGRIWLGHLLLHQREYERAVVQLYKGVELNPSHGQMRAEYGFGLILVGETDAALRELNKANELSPNDPRKDRIGAFMSMAHLYAENNEEAASVSKDLIDFYPDSLQAAYAYVVNVCANVRLGQTETARVIADQYKSYFGFLDWSQVSRSIWTEEQLNQMKGELELAGLIEAQSNE